MNVLEEASALINGDRLETYEGTDDTIVALWSGYLGVPLTVLDYANLMILLKVARTKGKFHRDSYVDIAGYAEVGPRLWLEKSDGESADEVVSKFDLYVDRLKLNLPRVWNRIEDVPEDVTVRGRAGEVWYHNDEYNEHLWTYDHPAALVRPNLYEGVGSPFTEVLEGTA